MFEEEFQLYEVDGDNIAGKYESDTLKITYVLEHVSDGYPDITRLITHEWLHGLFDWATEGGEKNTEEGDHFIMRLLNYD